MENVIKTYTDRDYEKLKEFVLSWDTSGLHDLSNLANHDFLRWFYSSSEYCKLTYYEENNKIKSILGCETVPFRLGGKETDILLIKDFYAEKGYGIRLLEAVMQNNKHVGGLGISSKARQIYRLYGWKDVAPGLKEYRFFIGIRRNAVINLLFAFFSKIITFMFGLLVFIEMKLRNVSLIEMNSFSEDDSSFVNRAVVSYENTNLRYMNYLNWRFSAENKFIKYIITKVTHGSQNIGYFIIGIQENKESATISDILLPEEYLNLSSLIIRKSIGICNQYKVKRVSMIASLPEIKHSLRMNLFKKIQFEDDFMMTNYDPLPFSESWHISTGFSDMDFYS